jgi:nucleoside-diphosphate-sugar epimerase
MEYAGRHNIPYVILRPGAVYGPGKNAITGRVGINTFGIYMHMGGSKPIPFTYVENCAEAIALAGITKGVDGEVFNIVDDDLPNSRDFLRQYKKSVRSFLSFPVPYPCAYFLCFLWEKYVQWSKGQLPPVFNRSRCSAEWKGNQYSNQKLKNLLGWKQKVPTREGLKRYFDYCKQSGDRA